MGQTLSEPVTQKDSWLQRNRNLIVGVSSMQGWRVHMEDAHCAQLSMPSKPQISYFSVFDGHGGANVAKYASEHLHEHLLRHELFDSDPTTALNDSFLTLDAEMQRCRETRDELSGSTGLAVLIRDSRIYCANAGDSRAVASVGGVAVDLSVDHKPSCDVEKQRIIAAGGWVDANRVNGNLALSRAFGDFVFKNNSKRPPEQQIVTAKPDVTVNEVTPKTEFIILACDGIWDVMTSQEVVNFIRPRIACGMDIDVICEDLLMQCLAPDCHSSGLGCDNMTAMIVGFLHSGVEQELANLCSTAPQSKAVFIPG